MVLGGAIKERKEGKEWNRLTDGKTGETEGEEEDGSSLLYASGSEPGKSCHLCIAFQVTRGES
jgi:hypothetical protein